MPYLGNPPAEAYTTTVKDSFSGDGSTTAFTLSQPSTTNDLRVVVENVIQDPTVAYSVSGTTLTFTSAPPTGTNNIYAVNLGPAVQTVTPPAEIGNATTFNSSVTVQGAFTSPGIDDNADATAITIDSSENVLVGKTSTAFGTAGTVIKPTTGVTITRSAADPLALNRLSTDGEIIGLYKDGTTVGSIGSEGGDALYIQSGTTNGTGLVFTPNGSTVRPARNGVTVDATLDLGNSSRRWRDLFLSGGVYLGGTGSANLLDDYEEGTWTPTLTGSSSNPTVTYGNINGGRYTKIGNKVLITGTLHTSTRTGGSGNARISGLPFTRVNDAYNGYHDIGTISIDQLTTSGRTFAGVASLPACNYLEIYAFGFSASTSVAQVGDIPNANNYINFYVSLSV